MFPYDYDAVKRITEAKQQRFRAEAERHGRRRDRSRVGKIATHDLTTIIALVSIPPM